MPPPDRASRGTSACNLLAHSCAHAVTRELTLHVSHSRQQQGGDVSNAGELSAAVLGQEITRVSPEPLYFLPLCADLCDVLLCVVCCSVWRAALSVVLQLCGVLHCVRFAALRSLLHCVVCFSFWRYL
jgi:hypothetical protein